MARGLVAFLRRIVQSVGLSFSKEKHGTFHRYTLAYQAHEAIECSVYKVRQAWVRLMLCHLHIV